VVVARDGEAAMRVLQTRGAPILLITDVSLPRSDGFALISELRRLSPPEQSAVLVFSPFSVLRTAALDLSSSLGISEVADKKLSQEKLHQMVGRALTGVGHLKAVTQTKSSACEELQRKVLYRTAQTFRVPITMLSVVLDYRRWLTMHVCVSEPPPAGLGASWPWRILQQVSDTPEPLIVSDVTAHPLFGPSPLVPPTSIRGFVVVPLVTSAGHQIGALGLLDLKPLALGADQIDMLMNVARRVADEFDAWHRRDLTRRELAEYDRSEDRWVALERLALTDPLTGLFNRRAGEQALARELARARRTGSRFCLALFDVDHFKKVNDLHGHAAGDQVLSEVSRILRLSFRASDLAVRWGGDEFLVLLPDVTLNGALTFADRTRLRVEMLSLPGSGRFTISAGVAEVGQNEDARMALMRADAKLYDAKAANRNCVRG